MFSTLFGILLGVSVVIACKNCSKMKKPDYFGMPEMRSCEKIGITKSALSARMNLVSQ